MNGREALFVNRVEFLIGSNGVRRQNEIVGRELAIAERLVPRSPDRGLQLRHSQIRERLFGGCTQFFIRNAEQPVLMVH
jgi:nucleotide-binding universal stress UspA family protein